MPRDISDEEMVEKTLRSIEKEYGYVPMVNQVLSERPDLFLPFVSINRSVFYGKARLDKKVRHLAAISAAAALGAEHCLTVQMQLAVKYGATKDEILESMQIGSVISMTRSQATAFRRYKEMFPE
ncbi:MAG: carboxymuconolactone decarboxylase family protein [Methanomassiliicoccaceae archaeon]|nr:carboxymuconolactone decarboxylase family protein [Methanomassiliicoccaceae archaeon]